MIFKVPERLMALLPVKGLSAYDSERFYAWIKPLLPLILNTAANYESCLLIWLKAITCYIAVHSVTLVTNKNLRRGGATKEVCLFVRI